MWLFLAFLAMIGAQPAPLDSPVNPWAEPTRGILAQRCGQCHLPNLPTSVPRALVVFDLTDEPWYGRMTHDQLDDLVKRVGAVRSLPEADRMIVERFVRCANDRACSPTAP